MAFFLLSDSQEMLLMTFLGPSLRCEWAMTKGNDSLVAVSVFVGMMVGSIIWGQMSDWVGRKPTLIVAMGCSCLAGLSSAFTTGLVGMCLARGLAGFGMASLAVAMDYFMEHLPPQNRNFYFTVARSSLPTLALIISSIVLPSPWFLIVCISVVSQRSLWEARFKLLWGGPSFQSTAGEVE